MTPATPRLTSMASGAATPRTQSTTEQARLARKGSGQGSQAELRQACTDGEPQRHSSQRLRDPGGSRAEPQAALASRMNQDFHRCVVEEGDLPDLNWAKWIRGESPVVTEAMVCRRQSEAGASLRSLANKVPSLARVLADTDTTSVERVAETPDIALWGALIDVRQSDSLCRRAVEVAGEQLPETHLRWIATQ